MNENVSIRRVGILGTGLIGASIGHGLAAAGWEVAGWDPKPEALDEALELGAITEAYADLEQVIQSGIEVLVLAGPPDAVVETASVINPSCLVMDVSGVKEEVIVSARPRRFVGTHPMAGREQSGPSAASPALFRGAAWVVVTDGADALDLDAIEEVVALLGARSIRMSASEHDESVAVISHLPQILATTLLAAADDCPRAMDLVSGSFRDLTRVAASDSAAWVQLLLANRREIVNVAEDFRRRLAEVTALIEDRNAIELHSLLARGKELRSELVPQVAVVNISLTDQPGELARVGRALERSGVDVRDLQLRHAPYGGGGLLTLSVRPGEAETLRAAAKQQGLPVEP